MDSFPIVSGDFAENLSEFERSTRRKQSGRTSFHKCGKSVDIEIP